MVQVQVGGTCAGSTVTSSNYSGSAGVRLGDSQSAPGWEGCGTSRVAWLQGLHPTLQQGTTPASFCLTGPRGSTSCQQGGQVRACTGDPQQGMSAKVIL